MKSKILCEGSHPEARGAFGYHYFGKDRVMVPVCSQCHAKDYKRVIRHNWNKRTPKLDLMYAAQEVLDQ